MLLTAKQLRAISPGTPLERCEVFVPHLNKYMAQYQIDTPQRIAHFLAQVLHESGGLKWLREIWGPTAAQSKYEGRIDLGNTVKGDGKKFMGHGLIQVTGRKNHEQMSRLMFGDDRLVRTPDLLATPEYGTQSACVFWNSRNLSAIADLPDTWTKTFRGKVYDKIGWITRRVNGGQNGLADRKNYLKRAIKVLNA